jgi:mannitol/fructose-specific phosphotransferase system IIA component (Ntr-type)
MLAEFLESEKILLNFEERTYQNALRKMLCKSVEKNVDQVVDRILSRDKVMPTALGKGIFLPRTIMDEKPRSEVIMAVNHGGLVFEDYGSSVANIIMLFLFSKSDDRAAILAQTLRLLNDDSLRTTLFKCKEPNAVITAITEWEKQ